MKSPGKNILIVEDDASDINLMQIAIGRANVNAKIHSLTIGDQVMPFLLKEHPHEQSPTPDIIILDLNIPGMNGKEVLTAIKTHEKLKVIPVIVISSSDYEKDVRECLMAHANCYLRKPQRLQELSDIIGSIVRFWLLQVQQVSWEFNY